MRPASRIALAIVAGLVPLVLGGMLTLQELGNAQRTRLEASAIRYAGLASAEVAGLAREGSGSPMPAALASAAEANDTVLGTAGLSQAYRELRKDVAAGGHPAAARNAAAMLAEALLERGGAADTELASLVGAMNAAPLVVALLDASRYATEVPPAATARLDEALGEFVSIAAIKGADAAAYRSAAQAFEAVVELSIGALGNPEARRQLDRDALLAGHGAFQKAALELLHARSAALSAARDEQSDAAGGASVVAAVGTLLLTLLAVLASRWTGRPRKLPRLESTLTPTVIDGSRTQYHRLVDTPEGLRLPMASKLKFPQLKLRGKIVLAAAAVFTIALGATLTYVVSSTAKGDLASADQLLSSLALNEATNVELVLKEHSVAAEALAQSIGAMMSDPAVGAQTYKDQFERQTGQLPNSVGIWALLTKDAPTAANPALMASQFALADGYFGPSTTRDLKTGAITWGQLDLSMENGFKDWFLDPLAKNAPSLVGPYLYKDMLYTSSTAIVRDPAGKAVGLAGVDFNGGVFADLIGQHKPLGTGWVGVINADGNWVVAPDASRIGKPADDESTKAAIAGAKTGSFHSTLAVQGENWRFSAIELPLKQFGISWTVLVGVPEATLLADANAQRNMLLGGGLVVLVLGLVAFALLGNSIAKPVSRMTAVMRQIADSDFSVEVPNGHRRDEIGDMAKAVEVFRQNGLRVAEMTEAEAARIVRDQQARAQMMAELQKAFGRVVDAAVAGDFGQRVETEFPDAELNAIASSINNLVGTVDRGLTETGQVLSALADTDLTKRMHGSYDGAFARLKSDTNAVADKLSDIVTQLKGTSRTLKTATGEILSGTNDLSERTTRQAATIEETSAAMEQLAVTVLQNAQRAKEASEVAGSVTRTAEEGGQVMSEANAAMERITASSAKISNIIGLIDDIAFQTNLLALNASVEAARAGDAGKGFAVVAVEVRRLAQSAASASSEVKVLIEQSGVEVKSGSKLVADASARLGSMLEAARSSNSLMDGIARESREQAAAIEEVNTAVRQLDEMTQHNAALVEETNAAIEQTEAQATDLDRIVDIFTVAGVQPAAPVRAPQPVVEQRGGGGIRALQEKVKSAARSYLTQGNAAIDREWAEF